MLESKSHRVKEVKAASVIALIVLCAFLAGCTKQNASPPSHNPRIQPSITIPPEVLKNALNTFSKAKSSQQDLSSGPCLGIIAPDWVLDIAHNPRQPIDDKSENQCSGYKNGLSHHFVEMDEKGQIIRSF